MMQAVQLRCSCEAEASFACSIISGGEVSVDNLLVAKIGRLTGR